MLRKLRPRLTYANVVASLALFLAVGGGTAFAVVAANQVNSESIINGQVKNQDLAGDSVGTAKLGSGAVQNSDIGGSAIGTGKVGDGSLLKQDFKAGELPKGAVSIPITHVDAGANGALRVNGTPVTIDGIRIEYSCMSGQVAVGVRADDFASTVYKSGVKAENGVLSAVNTSGTSPYSASGSNTANLDVIATRDGTWNRIDLGGSNGGVSGCNIWGLLIPGT
jgi:hypothetical protein